MNMSQSGLISPQDVDAQTEVRAFAVRSTLEGTNRILGHRDNRVAVIHPGKDDQSFDALPAAWTDGKTVTINGFVEPVYGALRDGWTEDSIFVATALNYHELAHCLFMPRVDTDFAKAIQDRGEWPAYNILQDMHDESLFVARYRPARHYFTRIAVEYFARTKHQMDTNYVLVSARRFLPDEVIDFFKDQFVRPDLIDDIDALSREYTGLIYPRDETRMDEVVHEFHELLKEIQPEGAQDMVQVSEHDPSKQAQGEKAQGPGGFTEGQTLDEEEQQAAADKAERDPDATGAKAKGSQPGGDSGDEEGAEGGEEGAEGDEPSSGGTEGGYTDNPTPPTLDDILEDASRKASVEVARELQEIDAALDRAEADFKLDVQEASYQHVSVDDDTADSARKVERALRRLRENYDPGWKYRQRDGRLDYRQMVNHVRTGDQDIFRRYDPGVEDVLSIEAVIAYDFSGSMQGWTRTTAKVLWITHTALKAHDAECTVLGYNNGTYLLRQRGSRSEPFIREYGASGGTSVCGSIIEAKKVFTASRRAMKLLFIVTDGAWYDQSEAQGLLNDRYADWDTVIIGIGQDVSSYRDLTRVSLAKTIQDPADLVSLFQEVVVNVASTRAEKVRTGM